MRPEESSGARSIPQPFGAVGRGGALLLLLLMVGACNSGGGGGGSTTPTVTATSPASNVDNSASAAGAGYLY